VWRLAIKMVLQPYNIPLERQSRFRPLLSLPARSFWTRVAVLNLAGALLMWIGSFVGPLPYFIGLVLLLPGYLIAAALEGLSLWLGPTVISDVWDVLFLPVTIAINVLIISQIRRRYRAGGSGDRAINNTTKTE
jgi:hypothetical protein